MQPYPLLEDLQQAETLLREKAHTTPVLQSQSLNAELGCRLFFKCENFQRTGAFKYRGACHALSRLDEDQRRRGVATHSSGNHGAALARAAAEMGVKCTVIMPWNALEAKKANVARYGARIIECEPNQQAREEALAAWLAFSDAVAIPPYDHPDIIAGQSTATLEFLRQQPALDALIAPVGGGGLLAGAALALNWKNPELPLYGAEPAGADDTARSMCKGQRQILDHVNTICDGLRAQVGELNFHILQQHVQGILTVEDAAVIQATRTLFERLKIVVEPSSAITLAAVQQQPERFQGLRVGLILTGGNVDLDQLPWQASGPDQ